MEEEDALASDRVSQVHLDEVYLEHLSDIALLVFIDGEVLLVNNPEHLSVSGSVVDREYLISLDELYV